MTELGLEKASPEESRRWAQYLVRREQLLLAERSLRSGIRLAILPSFAPLRSWTVEYRPRRPVPGEATPGRAVRSVCEVDGEYERFRAMDAEAQASFAPNIVRTTYEVSPALIAQLEQVLAAVTVPLSMSDAPSGTDGVTYLLERDQSFNRALLRWWASGPSNWSSARSSFEAAWVMLERLAEGG